MAQQTLRGQRDARGVREDSLTNRLRSLTKARPKKRLVPVLEPVDVCLLSWGHVVLKVAEQQNQGGDGDSNGRSPSHSLQRQIQGPLTLQWLVDDFVKAAGTGDVLKVDRYIRGGIPIDRTHSVLQYNALHASTALSTEQVTKRLLQAGADFTATAKASADDDSALHMVARYGSLPVAQELLRSNVPMRVKNHDGATPMDLAADRQDHKMERLLEPPPNAPTDVRVVTVTSTSIRLVWYPDQPSNGESVDSIRLSSYQYKVTWRLCATVGEFTEVCKEASFHIYNLLPASEYEISVQAGNHTVGWSAASVPATAIRTLGGVPNAMSAPIIASVGDTWIQMQIRLPQTNGSPITRLLIQTQSTGGIANVTTNSFRQLLKPRDYEQKWEALLCEVALMPKCGHDNQSTQSTADADREYTATGLAPGHVYYFRTKAYNQNGWSPQGEISDGICTNDCPKIVSASDRSMVLVWSKPYSIEHIDGYEIHARASSSTKWDTMATKIAQHSLEVCGLIPATAYSFRIVPHFARSGWGDAERCAASPLVCTLSAAPEKPLEFVAVDRTEKSITLSWDMPRCNGHVVLNYTLEYRWDLSHNIETSDAHELTSDGWYIADHEVAVGCKTYTVEGLQLGSAYRFRVSARNAIGCGPYQELSSIVWTYRFPPPSPPQCILKTNCSLHIQWAPPKAQHGDEANSDDLEYAYELQICQVDSLHALDHGLQSTMTWMIAASDLFEPNASITGLSPLGCYCFRVRASSAHHSPTGSDDNASVFSPTSAIFQTLRRM